jgi:hypothetical protein
MGAIGSIKEIMGKFGDMVAIVMPHRTCTAIEEAAIKLKDSIDITDDGLVDDSVAMRALKMNLKNFQNAHSDGRITPDMYITSPVNGIRKYDYKKIIGLNDEKMKWKRHA